MKKIIILPLFMAGILVFNSAFAVQSLYGPKIVIGSYRTQSLDPLSEQAVILHHNEDNSWSTSNIPWVIPPKESGINDTSCIENNCIAAPYKVPYNNYGYGTSMPFFLMSHDGGRTWYINHTITGLPHDMKSGELVSIYCEDTVCLSSGWYDTQWGTIQMLVTSFNHGQSWSFSSLPKPPSLDYGAFLKPVNCLGNTCTIGVAYVSDDKGLTWTPTKILDVPSYHTLQINGVQCNSEICLAAGNYITDTGIAYAHLLLLISKDKGHSWHFIDKVKTPDINDLKIKDFIYSNGSFVLVGGYTSSDNFSVYKGFILTSKDNGSSWHWIEDVSGINKNKLTTLESISCTDKICISGGDNDNGLNFIISYDNGFSWEAIKNVIGMNDIPNLDAVQCKESVCTVFGSFYNSEHDNHIHPISIESHDQGETWVVNKDIIDFPENIEELKFSDIV